MKNKIIKSFILLLLFVFIYFITSRTYSSLFSLVGMNSNIDIADFTIMIDDKNMNFNKEILLSDITFTSNTTNPNLVAPGSVGNFSFILDPSLSDVALTYSLTFVDRNVDNNKILTVTSVKLNDSEIILDNNGLSGIISLADIDMGKKLKFDVVVEWINSEENNEQDSLIGLQQEIADFIDIDCRVEQYKG